MKVQSLTLYTISSLHPGLSGNGYMTCFGNFRRNCNGSIISLVNSGFNCNGSIKCLGNFGLNCNGTIICLGKFIHEPINSRSWSSSNYHKILSKSAACGAILWSSLNNIGKRCNIGKGPLIMRLVKAGKRGMRKKGWTEELGKVERISLLLLAQSRDSCHLLLGGPQPSTV